MEKKNLTIGTLLDKGLIKKSTKVRLNAGNLRELKLLKPIPKDKLIKITSGQLAKRGLIKK